MHVTPLVREIVGNLVDQIASVHVLELVETDVLVIATDAQMPVPGVSHAQDVLDAVDAQCIVMQVVTTDAVLLALGAEDVVLGAPKGVLVGAKVVLVAKWDAEDIATIHVWDALVLVRHFVQVA